MPEGSARLRSISVRIMAIGLTGAIGITAIAGSAFYLGDQNHRALRIQAGASEVAAKANEIERLYAAARQDLTEFLRTQQTRPAEIFVERMRTIETQAAAVASKPQAAGVGAQLSQLGGLAKSAQADITALAGRVKTIGLDRDSGLLGASSKAGEQLERMATSMAQELNTGPAWRLAFDAAAIRRQEYAYASRREEALLGDMEVGTNRLERHIGAFPDAEVQTKLNQSLATYRAAFEAWRVEDAGLIRAVEKLNDQLIITTPIIDEIQAIAGRDVASASEALAESQAVLMRFILLVGGGVLLASLGIALVVGRSITGPLQRLRRAMQRLADGEIEQAVPGTGRRDEIGDMARMVEVFRDNAIERARMTASRDEEQGAQLRRAATVERLVSSFRDGMGETIRSVARAVEDLNAVSVSLSGAAGNTLDQTGAASAAVAEAAQNVGMVSTGATQLTASIAEIAARAAESNDVAQKALATAGATMESMRGLETSAFAIGQVVDLIRSIASQTNLLALNATIEAARAGEAGRGFSVVANEVKALAAQTSRATDDIARQIAAIQTASSNAGHALGAVNGIIQDLSGLAGAVAAAVEEQSAAVDSIASNVAVAADKAQAGTRAMNEVAGATRQAEAVAAEVEAVSKRLSSEAAMVEHRVADFIHGVRAA